jgi:hypothetical protein
MTSGEKRLGERLEQKLDYDYLLDHAWGGMAVICRRYDEMDACALALGRTRCAKARAAFTPTKTRSRC